jgi:hypothetical protein
MLHFTAFMCHKRTISFTQGALLQAKGFRLPSPLQLVVLLQGAIKYDTMLTKLLSWLCGIPKQRAHQLHVPTCVVEISMITSPTMDDIEIKFLIG